MEVPQIIKDKYPPMVKALELFFSNFKTGEKLLITSWIQEAILETALALGQEPKLVYIVEENQTQFDELRKKFPQIPEENCRKVDKVGGPDFEKIIFDEWGFPRPTEDNVVKVNEELN